MPINNTYEYFIRSTGCTYSTDAVKGWGIVGVGGGQGCYAVMSVAAFHYHSTDCGWDWRLKSITFLHSETCLPVWQSTSIPPTGMQIAIYIFSFAVSLLRFLSFLCGSGCVSTLWTDHMVYDCGFFDVHGVHVKSESTAAGSIKYMVAWVSVINVKQTKPKVVIYGRRIYGFNI